MTTVKELIEELQGCDQDAIVLYAYDENGLTGVHDFIDGDYIVALDEDGNIMFDKQGELFEVQSTECVTLDEDGNIMLDEQGELFEIFNTECDMPDGLNEQPELIVKKECKLKPAIKLFSR
jgi:hypothetical protein